MHEENEIEELRVSCPIYGEEIPKSDCEATVRLVKAGRVPRNDEEEWLNEAQIEERCQTCLQCPYNENTLLERAICYAVVHQAGNVQWGTGRPAILLATETMQVLQTMRADIPMLTAGVLYSVDVPIEEIEDLFGAEVAVLVAPFESKPELEHMDAWAEIIQKVRECDKRRKMLVLADLVAALRALWRDHEELGDAVWAQFEYPMEDLSWYYSGFMDALLDLEQEEDTKPVYWEASSLYKDLFVSYWADFERNILYEAPEGLEVFGLTKEECRWMPINELPEELREPSPDALPLQRWDVEEILDLWLSEKDKAQR